MDSVPPIRSDPPPVPTRRRTWPLVPPAPVMVVVLGAAVAAIIGAIGLRQLYRQNADAAATRASLLAATVAARISAMPTPARRDVLERTARRADAALWLIDDDGRVVEEQSGTASVVELPPLRQLDRGRGELSVGHVAVKFAVASVAPPKGAANKKKPEPRQRLVVACEVPESPEGVGELISTLLLLTGLLSGIAAAVAYAVSRGVRVDVGELAQRIHEIAGRGRDRADRAQDVVPIATLDEVGELGAAFNELAERFASAEKGYADALARLEEIDRERSTFLATVSHELRSPLNAILGFADVLLSEVDGPLQAEAREEVAIIKQSGLHLLGLINDILELSAIASGQLQLTRAMVDLRPIVDEVVREAVGARGDKSLELRVVAIEPRAMAYADARRIRQVLQNLVGNAVKFTPSGEVVVSVEHDEHYATIRVRDTGPGIPPEEREAIFDEYRQGGDRRARRRGSGLGLAIARRLALMHGGSVRLESEVGRGSTFVLRIPSRPPLGTIDRTRISSSKSSGQLRALEVASS